MTTPKTNLSSGLLRPEQEERPQPVPVPKSSPQRRTLGVRSVKTRLLGFTLRRTLVDRSLSLMLLLFPSPFCLQL